MEPSIQGLLRWDAVRDGPLFRALAEHPDSASVGIEVIDVDAAQLTDADARSIEKLQDCEVSNADGVGVVLSPICCRCHQLVDVAWAKHLWQRAMRLRSCQPGTCVGSRPPGSRQPTSERSRGGRLTRHRASCAS